ncbi:MAG: hypothetical protein R2708_13900 [Vicinamibacterales bacterium]
MHYWWLKDYPEAARQFELASRLPDAPPWLRTMAALTLTKGGDRAGARQLWTELHDTADIDWLREAADYRLRQLAALDDIDALTAIVERGRERARALDWGAFVRAGILPAVPTDPAGQPYLLTADGAVTIDPRSPLAPLPTFEAHQ